MIVRPVAILTATALSATFTIAGASVSGPTAVGVAAGFGSASPTSAALRAAHTDFDGDGRDDLAVGVLPNWLSIPDPAIDGVIVDYSSGLPNQLLAPAIDGDSGAGGMPPLASGDFDHDGYDDLAMARPVDTVPATGGGLVDAAGSVWIFYGGPGGLDPNGTRIHQDTPGIPGGNELSDRWGFALAAGDVNHDSRDDLAIGAPGEDIGTVDFAGTVTVLLGSPAGLAISSAKLFHQGTGAIPSEPEEDDSFGFSLAIADVTGGGNGDLIIGSKENGLGGITMLRGTATGLTTAGSDLLTAQRLSLNSDTVSLGDLPVVVAGDTNGDGRAEVIAGFSRSTIRPSTGGGAIVSIVGRSSGLSASGSRIIYQDTTGVPEKSEEGDLFGASLAVGDVTGNGRADVLVGIPGENKYDRINVGAFTLLKGSSVGLTGSGSQYFDQNTSGVPGTAEHNDQFADVVSLLDLNGDGRMDGVVGDQWENGSATPGGTVTIFRGSSSGLAPTQLITGASVSTADVLIGRYGSTIVG